MVSCLNCKNLLTIMNVLKNDKEPKRCTTDFACNRCGATMRVIQLLTGEPTKAVAHA
jgi:hypothetical protein